MVEEFTDLDTGRSWVVMLACFVTQVVIGVTNYSVGLIHMALLDRFNRGNAVTSWAGALHAALMSLASPMSSALIDKGSCRSAVMVSGTLFTVGYISTAFAPTLEVAIFTCSIAGLGGAASWTATMVSQGFFFRRYRNFAQGFVLSGIGAGIFALSPAIQAARETDGVTGFFIILACISIQVIVCGTLIKPSKLERYTQLRRKLANTTKTKSNTACTCSLLKAYFGLLTTKTITCLSASMFLYCFGTYIVFMNIPNYCTHQGFSDLQASFLLSVCGVASIVCRLLTGIAANSDGVDEILLYSGSMGTLALCTCLFPLFSRFYSGQFVYSVILGIYFGSPYVVISTINTQYVGISNTAGALGLQLCFGGFGALVGPVFSGMVLDKGGSYEQVFVLGGIAILLAAACGLTSTLFAPGKPQQSAETAKREVEMDLIVSVKEDCDKTVERKDPG